MRKGEIVVCIEEDPSNIGRTSIGKSYVVNEVYDNYRVGSIVGIIDNFDDNTLFYSYMFKRLSDHREEQLNKIL
jgi:hypothetical protein